MEKRNMWATALIIAFVITSLINGIKSHQIEVLVNDSVYINCSPNKPINVQWHHTPPKRSSIYVYAGGNFYGTYKGRFSLEINSNTTTYVLIIPNARTEDAGLYECTEDGLTTTVFDSSQLTVLDSSPVCTSNMNADGFVGPNTCIDLTPENMTLNCSVWFSGNPPNLIWRNSKANQTFNDFFCETTDNRIVCILSMRSDPLFDRSIFICQTATPSDGRYNCSTEVITVQYFLANVDTADKNLQENVSCMVTSNLKIHYNWTLKENSQDTLLSANRAIVIQNPGVYQCAVEYRIRNSTCFADVSLFNISVGPVAEGDQSLAIILPIVFILMALGIALVVFWIIRKIRRRRKKAEISSWFFKTRLIRIRPRLAEVCAILYFGTKLRKKLEDSKVIDEEDCTAIDAFVSENNKMVKLLSVILGRIEEAFDPFREALTEINPILGRYLEKGEIIAVDIETKIPELHGRLSQTLNKAVVEEPELFSELKERYNLDVVAAKPSNSITVFIYCCKVSNMRELIEIFNSEELESNLRDILNKLLLKIEPESTGELQPKVGISKREASELEKFLSQSAITDDHWRRILETNFIDLLVQIDSSSELEEAFMELKLFTLLQIKSIWGRTSIIERNEAILSLLARGNLTRFKAVRSALETSGQQHVVERHMSYKKDHLAKPNDKYNESLKESYRYQMLIHWNDLIENINIDALLKRLRARNTFTVYQKRILKDLPDGINKTTYLLRLLETGSQQHFDDFCECLKEIKQSDIVTEYLTPKSVNTDLDRVPSSFEDVDIQINTKPIKGRVLIISNRYYLDQKRSEMKHNERNLETFFQEKLFYDNKPFYKKRIIMNEPFQRLMDSLSTEQKSLEDYDVFLMFIFSYGINGEIFTIDGESVKIDDIFTMFDEDNCPTLKGKQKLFFIQTFSIASGRASDRKEQKLSKESLCDADGNLLIDFNLKDNMAVVYATFKGELEGLKEETGTWFIRCLLDVFYRKVNQTDFKTMVQEALELLGKMEHKITDGSTVRQLTIFKDRLKAEVSLVQQQPNVL